MIPSTPKIVWERPTVFLDSGQSVGESVFLERARLWIHQSIKAHAKEFRVPAVWIVYPAAHYASYHGAYPVSEYDKWEVRPLRWRNRPLDSQGFMASAAMFEEGCFRKKIKAPWRENNSKGLRASFVYLNPNRRDLHWAAKYHDTFRNAYNCAEFILGEPVRWGLPRNAQEWVSGVWTYQREVKQRIAKSYWESFGYHLPWWKWWKADREDDSPRRTFGIAEGWGDVQTHRHPAIALKWTEGQGERAKNDRTWEALLEQTRCKLYMIATTRESVPFDAMIAAARGATLVAPDVPVFRNIPGKHWLYPASNAGDSILWNQTDVNLWILGKLRHGDQTRRNQHER